MILILSNSVNERGVDGMGVERHCEGNGVQQAVVEEWSGSGKAAETRDWSRWVAWRDNGGQQRQAAAMDQIRARHRENTSELQRTKNTGELHCLKALETKAAWSYYHMAKWSLISFPLVNGKQVWLDQSCSTPLQWNTPSQPQGGDARGKQTRKTKETGGAVTILWLNYLSNNWW